MAGILEDWFPTSIWYTDVEEHASLREELLRAVRAERARDPQGQGESSSPLAWRSAPDLHRRAEFAPFVSIVGRCVMEVVRLQRWDLDRAVPELLSCTATIQAPHAPGPIEHGPRAVLAGVYHLEAAANAGNLFFLDPREAPAIVAPPMTEYTRLTFERVTYRPIEGRMLLFPGWLRRGAEPGRGDGERIALCFDVGVQRRG